MPLGHQTKREAVEEQNYQRTGEEGRGEAVVGEEVAVHHPRKWEVEEEKQTRRGEEGEQVGRDEQRSGGEEGEGGCQSQEEVGGPRNQKVEAGEEVQGEVQDSGGSWVARRPWGEQEVGGLDSTRWHASGLVLHPVGHTPCMEVEEATSRHTAGEGSPDHKHRSLCSARDPPICNRLQIQYCRSDPQKNSSVQSLAPQTLVPS